MAWGAVAPCGKMGGNSSCGAGRWTSLWAGEVRFGKVTGWSWVHAALLEVTLLCLQTDESEAGCWAYPLSSGGGGCQQGPPSALPKMLSSPTEERSRERRAGRGQGYPEGLRQGPRGSLAVGSSGRWRLLWARMEKGCTWGGKRSPGETERDPYGELSDALVLSSDGKGEDRD